MKGKCVDEARMFLFGSDSFISFLSSFEKKSEKSLLFFVACIIVKKLEYTDGNPFIIIIGRIVIRRDRSSLSLFLLGKTSRL